MNYKELTMDIILLLVVFAGVASFFYNPLGGDMKYLQMLASAVIGYFIGTPQVPVFRAFDKN